MFIIKFDEWRGWFAARVKRNTRDAGGKAHQYSQSTLSVLSQSVVADDQHQSIIALLWLYHHLSQRHWLCYNYEHLWDYNGEITISRVSHLLCTIRRTFWIMAIILFSQKCLEKELDSLYQLCCLHHWMSYLLCWSEIVHDSQGLSRYVFWTFQRHCPSTHQGNYSFWALRSVWCLPAVVHYYWYIHSLFPFLYTLLNL